MAFREFEDLICSSSILLSLVLRTNSQDRVLVGCERLQRNRFADCPMLQSKATRLISKPISHNYTDALGINIFIERKPRTLSPYPAILYSSKRLLASTHEPNPAAHHSGFQCLTHPPQARHVLGVEVGRESSIHVICNPYRLFGIKWRHRRDRAKCLLVEEQPSL